MLSHVVPEFNLICWNCKGCIGKSTGPIQFHHSLVAGSVPRSWLNASLLAQRLVAGSIFLNGKKTKKKETWKNWASYMPLSQLGMPSSSRPIHIMYLFFSFHIRSPAQCDVAGSFFLRFFRSKQLSQLDAIELERCDWASAVLLR